MCITTAAKTNTFLFRGGRAPCQRRTLKNDTVYAKVGWLGRKALASIFGELKKCQRSQIDQAWLSRFAVFKQARKCTAGKFSCFLKRIRSTSPLSLLVERPRTRHVTPGCRWEAAAGNPFQTRDGAGSENMQRDDLINRRKNFDVHGRAKILMESGSVCFGELEDCADCLLSDAAMIASATLARTAPTRSRFLFSHVWCFTRVQCVEITLDVNDANEVTFVYKTSSKKA